MATLTTRYPEGPILNQISDLDLQDTNGSEDLLHLSNARVVLADYGLLQHDFLDLQTENLLRINPRLRELERETRDGAIRAMIDDWLVANAAFISLAQAQQTIVNTRIPVDGGAARGYRPRGYGRAVVVPIRCLPTAGIDSGAQLSISPGLLDLKGAGVAPGKVPSDEQASNGLEALWCALRDYLKQRVIDAIFAREAPTLWTVPTYAILDLGFDILGRGRRARAGMHVRRAHGRRTPSTNKALGWSRVRLEMELLLRKYGLTSAHQGTWVEIFESDGKTVSRLGGEREAEMTAEEIGLCLALKGRATYLRIERPDIQMAGETSWPPASGHMVDFGTIGVRKTFDFPLCRDNQISLGMVEWPNSPTFVQVDPEVALSIEVWGTDKINSLCMTLTQRFRCNQISSQELRSRLEEPIRLTIDSWPNKQVKVPT